MIEVQVNLFQKPSFLHRLTHNMTRDCSLNSRKNKSSGHVVYKNCFLGFFWHSKQYLYTTCSELVFFREFNEQSPFILWVKWFKIESFWHRFTCTLECKYCGKIFSDRMALKIHEKIHAVKTLSYSCSFCERKFGSSQQAKNHEKVHTG